MLPGISGVRLGPKEMADSGEKIVNPGFKTADKKEGEIL